MAISIEKFEKIVNEKNATIARLRGLLKGTEHSLRYAGDLSHSQLVKIANDIRKELEQK
jgi:hypothetical protein